MSEQFRSRSNYNDWKYRFQQHPEFENVWVTAINRQNIIPEHVRNDQFLGQLAQKKIYTESTINSFQSRLMKILYCLINDEDLMNKNVDLSPIFQSIILQQPLLTIDQLCHRLHNVKSVLKTTMQSTLDFYCKMMGIPRYKLHSSIQFPRDRELRKIRKQEKSMVLEDVFKPVLEYIRNEVRYFILNKNNESIIRGAIWFTLMMGTCHRINTVRFLKLHNVQDLLKHGEIRTNIPCKRKRGKYVNIQIADRPALELAEELMTTFPKLKKISKTSSTPFNDYNLLFKCAKVTLDTTRKNLVKHYLGSKEFNKGTNINKIAQLMGHGSTKSTLHYINKFDKGPATDNYVISVVTDSEEDNDNGTSSETDNDIVSDE